MFVDWLSRVNGEYPRYMLPLLEGLLAIDLSNNGERYDLSNIVRELVP